MPAGRTIDFLIALPVATPASVHVDAVPVGIISVILFDQAAASCLPCAPGFDQINPEGK